VRDYINMMVKDRDVAELGDILETETGEITHHHHLALLGREQFDQSAHVALDLFADHDTALGRMRYALINLRRMIKEKNMILC